MRRWVSPGQVHFHVTAADDGEELDLVGAREIADQDGSQVAARVQSDQAEPVGIDAGQRVARPAQRFGQVARFGVQPDRQVHRIRWTAKRRRAKKKKQLEKKKKRKGTCPFQNLSSSDLQSETHSSCRYGQSTCLPEPSGH